MSRLRASCCVLALTLAILAVNVSAADDAGETEDRVKRQQQVSIRYGFTSDTQQRFTMIVQGVNTRVVVNDPGLANVEVSINETVRYARSTRNVVLTDTDTMLEIATYGGIDTFTFLDASGDAAQPDALPPTSGPGNLFVQGSSAMFSKALEFNVRIENAIPTFPPIIIPPPPIEIMVYDRFAAGVNNIVLNIDTTMAPDMVAQPGDDIIELTGSRAFVLTGGQTIFYNVDMMLTIFGNGGPVSFPDIASFFTLLSVSRGGVTGPELVEYTSSQLPPRSISGPGILRTGKEGGQNVAFFTNIGDVNMQISTNLVGMLLEFRVMDSTAEILSRYGDTLGERLVMLNGAQSFSYPDATAVRLRGAALSVFSGANLLQRFDSGTAPTVSAFQNHEIMRSMVPPLDISIPEGGATLYFNMDDNEVFVFPSRNQIIGEDINAALAQAEITPTVTTAEYSFISTPFGMATLVAMVEGTVGDAVEVVQVAPGTTIVDLGTGIFLSYKGMTIEVFNSNDMVLATFSGVSPLTINEQGFEYLSATNNFTASFGGPGRLYVDSEDLPGPRRAFYTQNQAIQNQVTSFVSGLPEPRVEVVRNPTTGIVSFQTGRQNLFTLNGARAVTAGPDQAGIYFNDQISVVNTFKVPDNAQASYTAADGRVRVPDPNNPGSFLFDQPFVSNLFEFDGVNLGRIMDTGNDHMFGFMNGYIYYGDNGILVAETNGINDGVYRVLTNDGFLHSSSADIPSISSPQLTVVDRSIFTFTGMSNTLLPRGGTYYGSADGNSSIYIRNVGFNNGVRGIYSQLNPAISSYNGTTGIITVTTAEGEFISSLRPGITRTVSIDRNGFIRYAGGEITFDSTVRDAVDGITSLVFWDGLNANMFGISDNITFFGPGLFWFEGGTAFYTSDSTTLRQVTQRINSVRTTFRRPFISSTPRTFREKFRTVRGGFPQTIDVYEGADVILNCTVLASNPAPVISFERRFFNETSNMFEFNTIVDGESAMITQVGNTAILTIMDISRDDNINAYNGTGVFRCIASNIVGDVDVTTTVNVLPAEAPAIVTGFLAPLEFRRNSSERLITIRAGGGVDGDMLDVSFRNVTVVGVPVRERVDDGLTIVRTLHIGCKGEGRPKADIRWFELTQDGMTQDLGAVMGRMLINDTRDDVVITEPREGRSVLSFSLAPMETVCRRFICKAMNRGGTALGGVDICTQAYTCENPEFAAPCSGTCGVGIAPRRYGDCFVLNHDIIGGTSIEYEQVPIGLFPLSPMLCEFGRDPCPIITYGYIIQSETDCSVTCGTGSIMRTVVCQQVTTVGISVTRAVVNDSFCAGQYRPSMVLTCSDNPPCPRWRAPGAYGPCSVTCGSGGVRMRQVTCVQAVHNETTFELILGMNNETVFTEVAEDLCLNTTRPLDTISCDSVFPCPLRWRPSVWRACPTAFGPMRGCQTRNIDCEEFLLNDYGWPGTIVNDSACEEQGIRRPHSVRSCQGFICDFGAWVVGRSESMCTVTCGSGGTIMQTVTCRDRDNGTVLEDGYCNPRTRPKEVVPCPVEFLRSRNCPGVCDTEPAFCTIVRLFGCDTAGFLSLAQSCCKSCPKQATPIAILPTEIIEVNVTAPPVG